MRRGAERIVERFPEALKSEIYVVSFSIWRVDYDPRRPYVDIGYNTESQVRRVMESECSYEGAARWEYAYWILDGFEAIGCIPSDPVGSELFAEHAMRKGIWYEGEADPLELMPAEGAGEGEPGTLYERLVLDFAEECIDVACSLHADGRLAAALGREVPIVVFDMDQPGWEVEATERANPPGLIADFVDHVNEL
ncbi:hypothetical protein AB0I94_21500 [Streptomyces sp. NPDC050147]|uniref:hypothetical protein n=1 Tax=Streptomyces sp. NPDC050147 TaxID=3155513 RepID=UPI00341D55AB